MLIEIDAKTVREVAQEHVMIVKVEDIVNGIMIVIVKEESSLVVAVETKKFIQRVRT